MTVPRPQLLLDSGGGPQPDASPSGVVLVLHGGREASTEAVRSRQLAVLRMIPIARRIDAVGAGRLVVARLRYAVRGWNGELRSPVGDAQWALEQLTQRYPGLPVGLVGHSMGGRTALQAGGHPAVRSVVGLAAWLPRDEPVEQLAGRRVLLVHGNRDRMTSPKGSAATALRLQAAGVAASYVEIDGERHAMLRRARLWHDLAAGFMAATLLDQSLLDQSVPLPEPNLLQKVMAGHARITV